MYQKVGRGEINWHRQLSRLGLLFTLLTIILWGKHVYGLVHADYLAGEWLEFSLKVTFFITILSILFGSIAFQLARLAYMRRVQKPYPKTLDRLFDEDAPSLTVLVPSFKEEQEVIYRTLLSAALQEYAHRHIVLLIDDPIEAVTQEDQLLQHNARMVPKRIQAIIDKPRRYFQTEYRLFCERVQQPLNHSIEQKNLERLYLEAAEWFEEQIQNLEVIDHADDTIQEQVLGAHLNELRKRAQLLGREMAAEEASVIRSILHSHYLRLSQLFNADLISFERKAYENLSHQANKAMNLNTYIGLVGKCFREIERNGNLHLEQTDPKSADLIIPHADYLLTVDADTILLPEFSLRLVSVLEAPENSAIAVAQSPYMAIPNAPGVLERLAGATTDIQFMMHQGHTEYGASFWVGADAILRKKAMDDIVQIEEERGYQVNRYIQHYTQIEDTESSIDLVEKGWSIYSYPRVLAYSATPADFGSLLIQRRRWANGGLIILGKLLPYLRKRWQGGASVWREAIFRLDYLISLAVTNIGLLVIVSFPVSNEMTSIWLVLTALPYYTTYAIDLKLLGYSYWDTLRVYALNLALLPVHLGGVGRSLQQLITGKKQPFARTPKVQGKTMVPTFYLAFQALILIVWIAGAVGNFWAGRELHGLFGAFNGGMLLYALLQLVWREPRSRG